MFLCFRGDGFEIFIQPLFEQIVFNIQLLLAGHVHRIYTEIWVREKRTRERLFVYLFNVHLHKYQNNDKFAFQHFGH